MKKICLEDEYPVRFADSVSDASCKFTKKVVGLVS